VSGGDHILHLLAVENVDGDEVGLSVTVLASLGGRDINHLAGAALDHDVAAQRGANSRPTPSCDIHGIHF
jgi:hypothetical protein